MTDDDRKRIDELEAEMESACHGFGCIGVFSALLLATLFVLFMWMHARITQLEVKLADPPPKLKLSDPGVKNGRSGRE